MPDVQEVDRGYVARPCEAASWPHVAGTRDAGHLRQRVTTGRGTPQRTFYDTQVDHPARDSVSRCACSNATPAARRAIVPQ